MITSLMLLFKTYKTKRSKQAPLLFICASMCWTVVAVLQSAPIVCMQNSSQNAADSVKTFVQLCDSLRNASRTTADRASSTTTTPGEYPFIAEQDQQFYRALAIPVPPALRFRLDAAEVSKNASLRPKRERTMIEQAQENLEYARQRMSPEEMREITRYKDHIRSALYVPGITSAGAFHGVLARGNVNIRSLFEQDLSPVLHYTVEVPSIVTISIFSADARLVLHWSQGFQERGNYVYEWNRTDGGGRTVPTGYYVGVVTISSTSIFRKGIRVE
jgi:hypothetical protein